MSKAQAQAEIAMPEFYGWMHIFKERDKAEQEARLTRTPDHYYLAQIAMILYNKFNKYPKPLDKFLMSFSVNDPGRERHVDPRAIELFIQHKIAMYGGNPNIDPSQWFAEGYTPHGPTND